MNEKTGMEEFGPKFRCTVCGYLYDPMEGDPDKEIPWGTPFDKLPSDWRCPNCGAPKTAFEPVGEE